VQNVSSTICSWVNEGANIPDFGRNLPGFLQLLTAQRHIEPDLRCLQQ